MNTRPNSQILRTVSVIALVAVFVLALLPPPPVPEVMNSQDKAGHFMAFVGLGLLGLTAWPRHAKTLVVALLAYGALIEVAQMLSALRQAELLDWLADAAGVATAIVLWTLGRRATAASQ
ncbi:MAG: VanZ family protein [Rhodocyclales bacterium]|nr:VanZ family protein [Rhodocyclales bacterium]